MLIMTHKDVVTAMIFIQKSLNEPNKSQVWVLILLFALRFK